MLTVFKMNIETGLNLFVLLISIYLFFIQCQQRLSIGKVFVAMRWEIKSVIHLSDLEGVLKMYNVFSEIFFI